jgi:glycine betaine/proline transport system substrate-binding protein
MLKWIRGAAVAGCLGALAAAGSWSPASAQVPESDETIKLAVIGYSGDNIIMFIYGGLLEKLGYSVEFVPADYLGQFAGLETGDLHIGSPGWDTTAKAALAAAWETGDVLNMGDMGIAVNEDWRYPLYVKDVCPGLPDWHALLEPACVEALSNAETSPKARFLSGPIE